MEMIPVVSSNVAAVGYDEEKQCLFVQFLNKNSLYRYDGVPQFVFEELRSASSVGSYLHRNIKNVYPYEQIG